MSKLEIEFPQLQKNIGLAQYSTFRVGGAADYFIVVKNKKDLKKVTRIAYEESINTFILGGGSNLIFADEGFRGLIVKNEAQNITVKGTQILAESGVLWSRIIQTAVENNLQGIEQLIGIPGTIGGAVRGNAGCHGVEIKDVLLKATLFNPSTGKEKKVKSDYFQFAYRESKLKKAPEVILEVTLKLKENKGNLDKLKQTMKESLLKRRGKQPTGRNAGSFFKNPSRQQSAGYLIDKAGFKGFQIGGAKISEQHANFFMSTKKCTQKNILSLAKEVAKKVYNKTKIKLEQEVHIIDEDGKNIQVY